MQEGLPETRTCPRPSCGRATASRRTVPVRDGVLQLFASLSIEFSRKRASFPHRRLLDGLQGPAEHGHGRRGRRRRRAARALLLARRLVGRAGADRADARVTYGKGRVVWGHVWRLKAGPSPRRRVAAAWSLEHAAARRDGRIGQVRCRQPSCADEAWHESFATPWMYPTAPRAKVRVQTVYRPARQLRCANARARRE